MEESKKIEEMGKPHMIKIAKKTKRKSREFRYFD